MLGVALHKRLNFECRVLRDQLVTLDESGESHWASARSRWRIDTHPPDVSISYIWLRHSVIICCASSQGCALGDGGGSEFGDAMEVAASLATNLVTIAAACLPMKMAASLATTELGCEDGDVLGNKDGSINNQFPRGPGGVPSNTLHSQEELV